MSAGKIVISFLAILLVVSNSWWFYQIFDRAISLDHMRVSLVDNQEALDQTLTIIPAIISRQASRQNILEQLKIKNSISDGFEKDGFYWTGRLGLRFDENDQLIEVRRSWE